MTQPLTDAINALTRYANETTGQSDTTLSDAVRTLCDGYGGGGATPFELLEEITVTEATRVVTIDMTPYLDYDILMLATESTTSVSTWLYTVFGSTVDVSGHTWQGKSNTFGGLLCSLLKNRGQSTYSVSFPTDWNGGVLSQDKNTVSSMTVCTYESTTSINVGSKFRIWGAKYADL